MRKCGWIDHDAAGLLARFVDPVDDFIFAVTLVEANLKLQFRGGRHAIVLDVSQRLIAVNMRLAFTQQVEVGAVQHEDGATHKLSSSRSMHHYIDRIPGPKRLCVSVVKGGED
jgi:hypothetical protein